VPLHHGKCRLTNWPCGGPGWDFLTVPCKRPMPARATCRHVDGTLFCTRKALKFMNPQMSGVHHQRGQLHERLRLSRQCRLSTLVPPPNIRVSTLTPCWAVDVSGLQKRPYKDVESPNEAVCMTEQVLSSNGVWYMSQHPALFSCGKH
jgi:hypothetical protein